MADPNIEVLRRDTYLRIIENSVGSMMFNSLIVRFRDSGKITDVLNNGEFSCAFFVSSVLTLMQMVERTNATVVNLKAVLGTEQTWLRLNESEGVLPGDVVFYTEITHDNGIANAHVGFVLNDEEAISTSYKQHAVVRHPLRNRTIDCIYRYQWPQG